jgi:hypothetical protein
MPRWRLQPVWPAVLSLHGSAASSRRLMPQSLEQRLSIPRSLLFGDGCRGGAGSADEDNYPTVAAEGMASSDLERASPARSWRPDPQVLAPVYAAVFGVVVL